jgi:hypothetical protein
VTALLVEDHAKISREVDVRYENARAIACKPNSVSRPRRAAIIPLALALLPGSSNLPESRLQSRACFGQGRRMHCGAGRSSSPIWSCSVWGLPCHRHRCPRGALLHPLSGFPVTRDRTFSPLPRTIAALCERWLSPPKSQPTLIERRYQCEAVYFLWYFPCRRRTTPGRDIPLRPSLLASTLPCGVRTFLSSDPET